MLMSNKIKLALKHFFRKATPDPIGAPNSDILIDYLDNLGILVNIAGATFSKIIKLTPSDQGKEFILDRHTLFVVNQPDFSNESRAIKINVYKSKPGVGFGFITNPSARTDWYFKIYGRAPVLPNRNMVVTQLPDPYGGLLFSIKVVSNIWYLGGFVYFDNFVTATGFALYTWNLYSEIDALYPSGGGGGGGGGEPL